MGKAENQAKGVGHCGWLCAALFAIHCNVKLTIAGSRWIRSFYITKHTCLAGVGGEARREQSGRQSYVVAHQRQPFSSQTEQVLMRGQHELGIVAAKQLPPVVTSQRPASRHQPHTGRPRISMWS